MIESTTFWTVLGATWTFMGGFAVFIFTRMDQLIIRLEAAKEHIENSKQILVRRDDYLREIDRLDKTNVDLNHLIEMIRHRTHDLAGALGKHILDSDK